MTDTTKTIFEKYQIRKTKKQKDGFIKYVESIAKDNKYTFTVEKGAMGIRNIVVGNADSAKVIYTAHYDTCAVLPFPNFITPKNIFIYLLYQLVLVAAVFFIEFLIGFVVGLTSLFLPENIPVHTIAFVTAYIVLFVLLWLMIAGPANKHTANDNTSGVTTLIDIMSDTPNEYKDKVAFIFFDLEEAGLFGSASFAKKHKNTMKDKLIINFDCVSDGKNIIFAVRRKAKKHVNILEKCFKTNDIFNVEVLTKGVFYPSDQANFNCGVGVAALRKTKHFNILYMNRIHTNRDTVYEEENIDFLKNGSIKLIENI